MSKTTFEAVSGVFRFHLEPYFQVGGGLRCALFRQQREDVPPFPGVLQVLPPRLPLNQIDFGQVLDEEVITVVSLAY